jgi:RNA polymerase sigma-70 factor, ECF subfamily
MNMGSSALDTPAVASVSPPSDSEIVRRVIAGERSLFEVLMRRHNQRVYRAARAIVKDETDVEDVMQQAYINAYTHLHQFEDRAQFSTWLTRIALNEAFERRKKTRVAESRTARVDGDQGASMDTMTSPQPDPEHQAYAQELSRMLEDAVDGLPESYRAVFMLRDVEGLSTSETSQDLGLGEEAVKTRLHRARAMIRRTVSARIGGQMGLAFQFHAPRCDRVVNAVLERLSLCQDDPGSSTPPIVR